ncbi:MAG: hypothetical protein GY719_00020 [bacterium]|nr:hypothetical protein [bacterium]
MTRKTKTGTADPRLQKTEAHIAAGEIEAVEEAWMAYLEQDPQDLAYYSPVAKSLGKAGEGETARFLLELLDEQLTEGTHWQARLKLLRRTGHLLLDTEDIHPAILETLQKLYGDLPSYEQMVDKVGLHRAVDDLPKIWKKAERLAGLLAFDIGSIVYMEGKGAGRVQELNMALESFKVEFEGGLDLRVGFGGATKLLQPLALDHVLYIKLEEPESLEKLRDEAPSELLRAVFESYKKPLTGAEIKRALAGIVLEKKWNSWWASARKHPQVIAAPSGKRAYVWATSSEDAQGAVWQAFEKADPRGRMDLLRRDGERDPQLKTRMADALASQAAAAAQADPGLACEIWYSLDRSGVAPAAAEWSPSVLITELEDPRGLFEAIKDRTFRERAYRLAREHRQDWPELYGQLLWQEQDARTLDLVAGALAEESPRHLETFLDQILSQPKKNPGAFVWLAERAAEKEDWLSRNPIRLLKQLLWAFTDRSFASVRAARLVPLAESGGTVPRLLNYLSPEQAADAETAIKKASGLESYQRQPLVNAIHLRFPDLRQEDEAPLYATQEKIDAKRAELKHLAEVDIPANRKAIEEARELGDLSENFEYKSARQRHEYLAARASALNQDLARVRRIDLSQVTGAEVVIGCRVRLVSSDNERTITILGPWESEPEKDILSSETDMAQSLLGLTAGDSVELAGESYEVKAIEPCSP